MWTERHGGAGRQPIGLMVFEHIATLGRLNQFVRVAGRCALVRIGGKGIDS